MARTSAELTPEEILIIGDLVPVGSPGQVPVVNTGGTGLEYKTLSGSGYALTSNPLSQFASTTSAQLAGVISDETGSGGNLVFSNSPALTTPSISAINVSGGTLTLPTGASDTLIGKITTDTFSTGVKTFLNGIFGLRNVANTFTSFFTNTNTASRTYTLKDASGTLAFTTDITGTNSGTNTGDQTSTAGLSNTTNKNLVTDAQLTVIGNTSGTNTGDNATNTTSNAYALTTPDFYQYSLVRTVASGNLTVSLKNYEGNNPTSTKPVKIKIGDTVRTITGGLTTTQNMGTNNMNLGSAELATKEVDLFLYAAFDSTSGSVKTFFSRIPSANTKADFTWSFTAEKGLGGDAGSYIATDQVVNIGRFNAILSAGAGYTWSIPATSVVINSPTFFTRTIQGGSQTGWTANNLLFYYTVNGDRVDFSFDANGISNSTSSSITLPFSARTIMAHAFALGLTYDNGAEMTTPGRAYLYGATCNLYKDSAYGAWTASGAKIIRGQGHYYI